MSVYQSKCNSLHLIESASKEKKMIKVENLKKNYISGKGLCLALNGVNFHLQEKGLVFILGKSGSGKSTLLNIIGTLDEKTSGHIYVHDWDYDSLTNNDLDSFRNDYMGFIFQDCCLIESLNVFDNLKIVLDLKKDKDEKILYESLQKVGLKGFEKRYPNQLSAGQKQRVAIARALVKKPRIILADEPTGNVDSTTGKLVLDILQELSKDCLILIVSHNRDDAFKYADRIIEIIDGQIISDEKRVEEYVDTLKIREESIQIPFYEKLTDVEIGQINEHISKHHAVKIFQNRPGFEKYEDSAMIDEQHAYSFKKKSMSSGQVLKYARKFYKTRVKLSIFTIFLISALLIILGLCQLFTGYNPSKELQRHMQGNNIMFISEGLSKANSNELDKTKVMHVRDEKKKEITELSKTQDVYDIIRLQINCRYTSSFHESLQASNHAVNNYLVYTFPYIESSNYTMLTNLEFIKTVLGVNELEVLAGSIEETLNSDKVIITDYLAKSIIYHRKNINTYEDLVHYKGDSGFISSNSCRIGAIVKTDFEEKHQNYINEVKQSKLDLSDERFLDFSNDIYYKYSWVFTPNPYFKRDYLDKIGNIVDDGIQRCSYYYTDCLANQLKFSEDTSMFYSDVRLKDNEIGVGYTFINKYFKSEVGSKKYGSTDDLRNDFAQYIGQPVTLTFKSDATTSVYEKTFVIKELSNTTVSDVFYVSNSVISEIREGSLYRIGLVMPNSADAYAINQYAEKNNMYIYDVKIGFYTKLLNIVAVFKGVFVYLSAFICIGIFAAIFLDALYNIKRNRKNIGIIRSLGGKIPDLVRIFLIQTIFNGIFIALFSTLGIKFGSRIINDILVKSLAKVFNTVLPRGFVLVEFNEYVVIAEICIVFFINIISSVLQILSIRKIRPINIIRSNKE